MYFAHLLVGNVVIAIDATSDAGFVLCHIATVRWSVLWHLLTGSLLVVRQSRLMKYAVAAD